MSSVQKVYDASGSVYYPEVERQTADAQGRVPLRQVMAIASSVAGAIITAASVSQETAGAIAADILAENTDRKGLSIYNANTANGDTAYLTFGEDADSTKIPIRPGQWWHMKDTGMIFTQAVNVIRGGSNDITLVVVTG